jgi:hypothetical protein
MAFYKLSFFKDMDGDIGRVYMTNEHFRGSMQYYQKKYAECMTICSENGPVDLLLTYTLNPDCPEMHEMLQPGQKWQDRPDVVARLFIDKLEELIKDVTERHVLGPVKAWFNVVEHQKA